MLEERVLEPECLDDTSLDQAAAADSYRFMQKVNMFFGGTRAVMRFLEEQAPVDRTVRVLDLGSGSCDIPLAVSRKLNRRGPRIVFTCLEINAAGLAIARRNIARAHDPFIDVVNADAFTYQPAAPFDFAVGSMFFHHLSNDRILHLLHHLRPFVRRGLFINDLYRAPLHYALCRWVVLASSPIIRHDAVVSIQRGFTENDLLGLLRQLEPSKLLVCRQWFYRITAAVLFGEPAR